VTSLFRRTLQVGAQFGVVIVQVGKFQVEVATFRSEAGYNDGRHPTDVKFSDPRQDAARRDFTINGMFLDPPSGEVIDYVGGQADLAARRIRAIGRADDRFAEDHLRMLRAVRFAGVLDFELEPQTEQAIVRHAALIADVSAERIWQEWEKILRHPNRALGWRLAERTGLVRVLWPDLTPHAESIARRLERLAPTADAIVALACLFLPLPVEAVHERCRQLSLDNRSRLSVAWLVEHANDLLDGELDVVAIKKRMADGNWTRLVELSSAKCRLKVPSAESSNLDANLAAAGSIDPDKVAPPPLIDGHDIMAMGEPEGRRIGQVLAQVYDAQLADQIPSRAEALELARRLLGGGG